MTKKPQRPTGGPTQADVPYGGKEGEKEEIESMQGSITDSKLVNLSLPRPVVEQILGNMMSAVSQRAYNSRWITGTETSLPFVVGKTLQTYPIDGGAYTWGQTIVGAEEAQTLVSLAQALDYWVMWDEQGKCYVPYRG
jgi:hypothetical protein